MIKFHKNEIYNIDIEIKAISDRGVYTCILTSDDVSQYQPTVELVESAGSSYSTTYIVSVLNSYQ